MVDENIRLHQEWTLGKPKSEATFAASDGSVQWLFCAECGKPYATDRPYLTIGGKPCGLRRLCDACELSALAGMIENEAAPNGGDQRQLPQ